MQTIRDNAWWILGTIFLLVLFLRLGNFIGSIWTGLGVAAIVGVALGISLLPSWKNLAVAALMGWLAVTVAAPMFWNNLSFALRDALGTRRLDTETRVAETVGSRGASASRLRYQACSEWEDRFIVTVIKPLRLDIATLSPSDPQIQNKIADLKTKEEFLKQELAKCADGLRYAIPDIEIPELSLPTTRTGATILLVALFLFGFSIYRSTKESRWTRWIGGPLLILAILYLIVLLFDSGADKKIEEGVKRWQISTKESPKPPPSPALEPKKEEKKMIAAKKTSGKQWERRVVLGDEFEKPSNWSLPELPAVHFSMRRGQIFSWPHGGNEMCGGIFLREGQLKDPGSTRTFGYVFSCYNDLRVECASASCRGFAGYAFKDPRGIATLVER